MGVFGAALVAAFALGALGMRAGDAIGAFALVHWADERSGGERADEAWLDAARELGSIRPWQPEWADARHELDRISLARRLALDTGR